MYLFQKLLDTYMLNRGHLKLLCIQCLEFSIFAVRWKQYFYAISRCAAEECDI